MEGTDSERAKPRVRVQAKWKPRDQRSSESNMVIGKIISSKGFNKRSVIATIRKGWNLGEETEIVEMDDEAFVFSFKNMKEKHRLLRGRPWTIQGSLMSIQPWDEYMVVQEVDFRLTPIWVQFHNLPMGLLEEEENIHSMSGLVGELLWYEKPKMGGRFNRSFARARILVDTGKPLATGFWMDRPDKSEVWVSIKYERLQAFCYKCGVIGHDFRGCNEPIATDDQGERAFGAWMVANAERDVDEAMVKFKMDWAEEDSRGSMAAREPQPQPSERGLIKNTTKKGDGKGDHKAPYVQQKVHTCSEGNGLLALSPMTCDRPSVSGDEGQQPSFVTVT